MGLEVYLLVGDDALKWFVILFIYRNNDGLLFGY